MPASAANDGALPGLPDWAGVEVPARVGRAAVVAQQMEPLPHALTEICRREMELSSLVVDAAVSGDRTLALQALLLDPMGNDIDRSRAILDDFLVSFRTWLPQFWD